MNTFGLMIFVVVFAVSVSVCIVILMTLSIKFVELMKQVSVLCLNLLIVMLIKNLKSIFKVMCRYGRFVTNKYTRTQFWVTCGKCKACQQEKAARRSNRIRNEYDGYTPIYFVTLTYDRHCVPYFTQADFLKLSRLRQGFLPIRRKSSLNWNYGKKKIVREYKENIICQVPVDFDKFRAQDLFLDPDDQVKPNMRWLKKSPFNIGVVYFKDVQDFKKRLNINLRRAGYEQKYKVFNVSEYGGDTIRPHHHLLISIDGISQEEFHNFVIKSWPFGRRIRDPKSCELVTKDPAGYVSSYVNSGNDVSSFLTRYFKPRHSASKYYGYGLRSFSLEEIKKKVYEGTLNYLSQRVKRGVLQVDDFPIPKYVINRWYPLFKGYSRLDGNQVLEFLSRGFDVEYLDRIAYNFDLNNPWKKIDYRPAKFVDCSDRLVFSDLYRLKVRLQHAFENYKKVYPDASYFDYAKDYYNTWNCWRSTQYKYFRLDERVPECYKFDNLCMMLEHVQDKYFENAPPQCPRIFDNNNKPSNLSRDCKMVQMFDKYCKQKKTTSLVLSEQGIEL